MSYARDAADDLSRLTLSAAYEIDLRLKGHALPPSVFKRLGIKLQAVSGADQPIDAAYLQSDPQTTEILAKAVEASSNETILDVSMLAESMKRIIEPLKNEDGTSRDKLILIRAFCLALHKVLAASSMPQFQEWEEALEYEHSFT